MSSGERLTPFMLFFCEHRDVVQAAHPTLAPHELSALIADKWKALPADRARAYGVLSATYAEQKKPGVTAQPRKRKERREKDPKAPKSATSAYMRVRPRAPAAAGLPKPPDPAQVLLEAPPPAAQAGEQRPDLRRPRQDRRRLSLIHI